MSLPPPPPPPVYGSPYGMHGHEHPEGTTVLVLGVLSLAMCQVLGPVAWIMGNNVLAEIDRNPGRYSNRNSVQAGRICGIISSCLVGAMFVGIAVVLITVAAAA